MTLCVNGLTNSGSCSYSLSMGIPERNYKIAEDMCLQSDPAGWLLSLLCSLLGPRLAKRDDLQHTSKVVELVNDRLRCTA